MTDAIKTAIKRRATRSFLIKSSDAAERLLEELKTLYTNAWDEQSKQAISRALDRLQDMTDTISEQQKNHILSVMTDELGGDAMLARLRKPIINLTDALFRAGATEVAQTISFNAADFDAIDVVSRGNMFWVKDSPNSTSAIISKHLNSLFEDGIGKQELTARLSQSVGSLVDKGKPYFDMLADHTATKTRELGRITGYERAGVKYVRVQAYLDARTSAICRSMHGRIIAVSRLTAQRDNTLAALKAGDYARVKNAWTMHASNKSLSGKPTAKIKGDTACPPYHFRCRTITIAYQPQAGSDDIVETVVRKTYNREQLSRQELQQLMVRVKEPRWRDASRQKKHYNKHATQDGLATQQYESDLREHIAKPDAVYTTMYGTNQRAVPQVVFAKRYSNGQLYLTAIDVDTGIVRTSHYRKSGSIDDWAKEPKNAAIVQQTNGRLLKWL